jgi:hypothetical protein
MTETQEVDMPQHPAINSFTVPGGGAALTSPIGAPTARWGTTFTLRRCWGRP